MAFKAKIQEVTVEKVVKGRSNYEVANVNYLVGDTAKTQKIVSFANPQVFKAVQALVGKTVQISTVVANGYTNWSEVVEAAGDSAPASTGAPGTSTGRTSVSTYETPEERKIKQLYIVRQSSITNAIATLSLGAKAPLDPQAVLGIAQTYVDFVYGNNIRSGDLFAMDSDDPEVSE
jgi:hypothetical protein